MSSPKSGTTSLRRKLLARVSLGTLKHSEPEVQEEKKRLSAIESYRLVSTIGQGEEEEGWEVEVTRALIVSSLHPNKERGSARADNVCFVFSTLLPFFFISFFL